mmetsp:Transcript_30641/g.60104  ORF Transcript_30641/g.60104 Transcript_30641/m.60104 type:complete len:239 (+) Transcript_30641:210-926(+)
MLPLRQDLAVTFNASSKFSSMYTITSLYLSSQPKRLIIFIMAMDNSRDALLLGLRLAMCFVSPTMLAKLASGTCCKQAIRGVRVRFEQSVSLAATMHSRRVAEGWEPSLTFNCWASPRRLYSLPRRRHSNGPSFPPFCRASRFLVITRCKTVSPSTTASNCMGVARGKCSFKPSKADSSVFLLPNLCRFEAVPCFGGAGVFTFLPAATLLPATFLALAFTIATNQAADGSRGVRTKMS